MACLRCEEHADDIERTAVALTVYFDLLVGFEAGLVGCRAGPGEVQCREYSVADETEQAQA